MSILPNAADFAAYAERGWWTSPVLFTPEQVAAVRREMARAYSGALDAATAWPYAPPIQGESPDSVRTLLWAWRVNDTIRELVFDPRITSIAAALMGVERVRVWQDQAIWKPGTSAQTRAGNIGWHQDYAYWQSSSTTNMVSANVALQDTTLRNGALRVLEGSHRFGLIAGADGFFDTDIDAGLEYFRARTGVREETVLELRAGQVSFHHSLTVHGSGPNNSIEARMVIAPAYMPDGTWCRVEGQPESPHAAFLGDARRHGTPFAGDFFPCVPDGGP